MWGLLEGRVVPGDMEFEQAPIAAKEMVPILVAAAVWGRRWRGLTVCCHCYNEAVVASIQATIAGSSTWLICCVVCFFWKLSLDSFAQQSISQE